MKWHFQFTPHDTHDWDAQSWPVLLDMEWQGKLRKVVLHANRNGFFYVLDRITGEFLRATKLIDNVTWATGIDAKGRPILVPGKDPTPEGNWVCPSVKGATNWMSQSYNPGTGLLYVITLEQCGMYTSSSQKPVPMKNFSGGGATEEGGQVFLRALDPKTGERVWEYPMTGIGSMWAGTVSNGGRRGVHRRRRRQLGGARRQDRKASVEFQRGRAADGVTDHLRAGRQAVCRDCVGDGDLHLRVVRAGASGAAAEGGDSEVSTAAGARQRSRPLKSARLIAWVHGENMAAPGRSLAGRAAGRGPALQDRDHRPGAFARRLESADHDAQPAGEAGGHRRDAARPGGRAKSGGAKDVPFFDDYKKMLDETKPDIVWAFVENNRHLEIAKNARPRRSM